MSNSSKRFIVSMFLMVMGMIGILVASNASIQPFKKATVTPFPLLSSCVSKGDSETTADCSLDEMIITGAGAEIVNSVTIDAPSGTILLQSSQTTVNNYISVEEPHTRSNNGR